jgi:hypothetical protein
LVVSAAGFAASEVAGVGDAESDFESLEARTADVMESASSASVTAVSEGHSNLFSPIGVDMVR